nr:uncharacterized protein LOC127327894 isoform X2 [Lolium perenne]XP_051210659.1 uncharacterized protein LOC127327894 isoform X3 [Lolium perenne]
MAALLRQGASRIGGSVLQRTQAAVRSPAVAEERRLLVPRRMLHTDKRGRLEREKDLEEQIKRLKPHQICWELMKIFPARKIFNLVAGTTAVITLASLKYSDE